MFHYVIHPTLNMRKSPKSKSEVVSQALFSEEIALLEESGEWCKIKTLIDDYTGWTLKTGICSKKTPFPNDKLVITNRLATHIYEHPDTIYGPILTLPFESRLSVIDYKNDDSRWLSVELLDARKAFVQRGDIGVLATKMNEKDLCLFSQEFLGLPYTWGGRSSFGYDCSGFVQMLYRQMGVSLPRDSKDQFVASGFKGLSVNDLSSGDLVFFGSSKEQIQHVGMSLGGGRFIHTSAVTENKPFLRISSIEDPAWNGSGYYPYLAGRILIRD